MQEEHTASIEIRSSKTLWFGLFASPIIWSIHFMLGYLLIEAACGTQLLGFRILGVGAWFFFEILLTLFAIAGVIWNAWWSYRSWRYYASLNPEEEFPLQAYDRDEFLALSGLLLSGIILLLLLYNLYPFLTLRPCG